MDRMQRNASQIESPLKMFVIVVLTYGFSKYFKSVILFKNFVPRLIQVVHKIYPVIQRTEFL